MTKVFSMKGLGGFGKKKSQVKKISTKRVLIGKKSGGNNDRRRFGK